MNLIRNPESMWIVPNQRSIFQFELILEKDFIDAEQLRSAVVENREVTIVRLIRTSVTLLEPSYRF